MRKNGLSEVMVWAVMSLYDGTKARMRVGSAYSEEFEVKVGVHQGSVPGVGKLFSRRAALTIPRVVEGQGLLSRTAACFRKNCISSQFWYLSTQNWWCL